MYKRKKSLYLKNYFISFNNLFLLIQNVDCVKNKLYKHRAFLDRLFCHVTLKSSQPHLSNCKNLLSKVQQFNFNSLSLMLQFIRYCEELSNHLICLISLYSCVLYSFIYHKSMLYIVYVYR